MGGACSYGQSLGKPDSASARAPATNFCVPLTQRRSLVASCSLVGFRVWCPACAFSCRGRRPRIPPRHDTTTATTTTTTAGTVPDAAGGDDPGLQRQRWAADAVVSLATGGPSFRECCDRDSTASLHSCNSTAAPPCRCLVFPRCHRRRRRRRRRRRCRFRRRRHGHRRRRRRRVVRRLGGMASQARF